MKPCWSWMISGTVMFYQNTYESEVLYITIFGNNEFVAEIKKKYF